MFSFFRGNSTVHGACFRDTGTTFIPVRDEKFTPCLRELFSWRNEFILQGKNTKRNMWRTVNPLSMASVLWAFVLVDMRILSGAVTPGRLAPVWLDWHEAWTSIILTNTEPQAIRQNQEDMRTDLKVVPPCKYHLIRILYCRGNYYTRARWRQDDRKPTRRAEPIWL